MADVALEQRLDLLDVRLEAMAVCEIAAAGALRCQPLDFVVVHFVLEGTGTAEFEHGCVPLRPGTILVVPKQTPKIIAGPGATMKVVEATASCPLVDGMVKFGACEGEAGLLIGCASLSASLGKGFGLFDQLREPLVEEGYDPALALVFEALLRELSKPKVGTRAIASTLMKHVLIVMLRQHLERRGKASPLYMPMVEPQLGKALMAILSRPQDPHSVGSLARIAGMSRTTFARRFTAVNDRTPMEFVQSVRLRTARQMLKGSSLPIKSIAVNVGYSSRSHFSRAFREAFGLDPSRYRAVSDAEMLGATMEDEAVRAGYRA